MSSVEFDLRFQKMLSDLQPIVMEAVSRGHAFADWATQGKSRKKYPFLHPINLRVGFRDFLDSVTLPDGWQVGGNSTLMGQTLLVSDDFQIRFLKERRRTYPGGTPPAGRNHARRAFYYQPKLLNFDDVTTHLDIPMKERLLLLWDYGHPETGPELELRMVRPIEGGTFGRVVPIDLSVPLNDLLTEIKFISADEEDLDLFSVEISKEENENDAEQSG